VINLNLETLSKYDRQIIFLVVLVLTFLPAFYPIGLPLPQYFLTNKVYNAINSLNPGDLVLISFDFSPGEWVELGIAMKDIMQHLFIKHARLVIIAFSPNGPALANKVLSEIDLKGAVYGKDYVVLGYIPGDEAGMAAFVSNPKMFTVDYYGNPIANMPIMNAFNTISDFKMYIFACYTWVDPWLRQFSGKVGMIIGVLSADIVPQVMPYINSGQMYSLIRGSRGAAEYEQLMGIKGEATAFMDAASLTVSLGVVLTIVANYGYLKKRLGGQR
jgi:hypothetical protein